MLAPPAAVHVDEQACALLSVGRCQAFLHLQVDLVLGQHFGQILREAVVAHLAQGGILVVLAGMFHVDVEEVAVAQRASEAVGLAGIEAVQQSHGVGEPEALSGDVAQVGLREVVLQACCHAVGAVGGGVEVEAPHPLQVALYLWHAEGAFRKAHVGNAAVQLGQQGVGTLVHALSAHPHQWLTVAVVVFRAEVGGSGFSVLRQKMLQVPTNL